MKAVDRFGILRPALGDVKDCAVFGGGPPRAPRSGVPTGVTPGGGVSSVPSGKPPAQDLGPEVASVRLLFTDWPQRVTELNTPTRYPEFGIVGVRVVEGLEPDWATVPPLPLTSVMSDFPAQNDIDFAPYQVPLDPRVTVYKVDRVPWIHTFSEAEFQGRNGEKIGRMRLIFKPLPGYTTIPTFVDVRRGDKLEMSVAVTKSSLEGRRAGGRAVRPQNAPVFGAKGSYRGMTVFGMRPGTMGRMF